MAGLRGLVACQASAWAAIVGPVAAAAAAAAAQIVSVVVIAQTAVAARSYLDQL